MNDTPQEIEKIVRDRIMARTGAERMAMGSRMFDVARTMILASFPPNLSEIERKSLLCKRLYGDEVDVEAFTEHLRTRHARL